MRGNEWLAVLVSDFWRRRDVKRRPTLVTYARNHPEATSRFTRREVLYVGVLGNVECVCDEGFCSAAKILFPSASNEFVLVRRVS